MPSEIQPQGFPPLPSGWTSEWEMLGSADGSVRLFLVRHRRDPEGNAPALLVIHGLGEHGGRYLHLPHYLGATVGSVWCLDHRGHGRSEGPRGHAERFDALADDVAVAIRRISRDSKAPPKGGAPSSGPEVHLLGHSMGALVVLRTILRYPDLPIRSVTVSAPFFAAAVPVPWAKKLGAVALNRIWGSMQLRTGLDAGGVSRDPEVVKSYCRDRLVHDRITPRLYSTMIEAVADTLARKDRLQYPVQFLIPLKDRIVDSQLAMEFAENAFALDKRVRLYPDAFHEPLNDLNKEEVMLDIRTWIEGHSNRSPQASKERE